MLQWRHLIVGLPIVKYMAYHINSSHDFELCYVDLQYAISNHRICRVTYTGLQFTELDFADDTIVPSWIFIARLRVLIEEFWDYNIAENFTTEHEKNPVFNNKTVLLRTRRRMCRIRPCRSTRLHWCVYGLYGTLCILHNYSKFLSSWRILKSIIYHLNFNLNYHLA
jgi:hypothetical protein